MVAIVATASIAGKQKRQSADVVRTAFLPPDFLPGTPRAGQLSYFFQPGVTNTERTSSSVCETVSRARSVPARSMFHTYSGSFAY